MRCPNDAMLWAYLGAELGGAARAELEPHLESCRMCLAALHRVQTSRMVIRAAATGAPNVNWGAVDVGVRAAMTGRKVRRASWARRPGTWAVACAVAVLGLVWVVGRPHRGEIAIEAADRASVDTELQRGAILHAGAMVTTEEGGSALAGLPDGSRVHLGARSRARFARASRERIEIQLLSGAVAIDAAHVARRAFTVEAGSARVHVVGTAFRVEHREDETAVAVARGRVRVDVPGRPTMVVAAGERLVLGADPARATEAALTRADQEAFAPLGIAVDSAPVPDAKPSNSADALRSTGPAPRKPARTTKQSGSQRRDARVLAPDSAPAAPRTAEEEFLGFAEESLATGACPHYLPGLADLAEWSRDPRARERARIDRARCYDALGIRGRAKLEYRRYLEEYRAGTFAAEAERALHR